jgi:hypothetical protein
MKTLEEVINSFETETLDGRDANRLANFVKEEDLPKIGVKLKDEYVGKHKTIEWTKENILEQLQKDVEFGFEKALNQRGISSSFMYEVVRMWNNILEDGLEDWDGDNYAMYGLPLFKATALKYGWENPIDDDTGSESWYGDEDPDPEFNIL